jgi:hypothetical protein
LLPLLQLLLLQAAADEGATKVTENHATLLCRSGEDAFVALAPPAG